jgi:hypothetical protein
MNPVSVVINRPKLDPIRLRHKGTPEMMEDGNVSQKFMDEKGRVFWLSISQEMLKTLQGVYDGR